MENENQIREDILSLIFDIYKNRDDKEKISGKDYLNYAGGIFDHKEVNAVINSLLDGWLGIGKKAAEFEEKFANFNEVKSCIVTNSGSSANLIAISSICSSEVEGNCLQNDEVITPASTFPTTLNPIIQNKLIPKFVDIEIGTYNIDCKSLPESINEKTKAIMIPHVLGNPNEMDTIKRIANEHNLFLIEDCCDALGSTFKGKKVGSWGDIGTCSFYPAHHMTMGEGGAIFSNNKDLIRTALSLRDWGRACFCKFDEKKPNGACGKRFDFEIDGIKTDHRYLYSNIGYNLKPIELQCAFGLEQLLKLPDFIKARKRNYKILFDILEPLKEKLYLPRTHSGSDVSWFAFPITIKEDTKIKRNELMLFLEKNKIQTRILFAGNILKHPGYVNLKYHETGNLTNSNLVFRNSFFVGVYPGLSEDNMKYIGEKIVEFILKSQ